MGSDRSDYYEGRQMYSLAEKIFPICRSITGDGVRETLGILQGYIGQSVDIKIYEVPSGTKVFDWIVPMEWRIREAYIEDELGNIIIDFKDNNLYVVGYSHPVDRWVDLEELKEYVHTQEDQPDVIPYVTSYYKEAYGFCMPHSMLSGLNPGRYHMYIDSELFTGSLTYGDVIIKGETEDEIFFSTYICHPSMANNECSGPTLAAELIKYVSRLENRRYTYRFVFAPETIGAITYLATENRLQSMRNNVAAGFVLTCVGDDRTYSFVESPYGDTYSDKLLSNVLQYHCPGQDGYKKYPYLKRGSDERQYCSPSVGLPVVTFCRSKFHEYPEYHTSADDMDLISAEGLHGSFEVMKKVIDILENNGYYHATTLCEPQLGKRGLYPTTSQKFKKGDAGIFQDILAYADGRNDVIDLSNRLGIEAEMIVEYIKTLREHELISFEGE